jgi:hypothetical protein
VGTGMAGWCAKSGFLGQTSYSWVVVPWRPGLCSISDCRRLKNGMYRGAVSCFLPPKMKLAWEGVGAGQHGSILLAMRGAGKVRNIGLIPSGSAPGAPAKGAGGAQNNSNTASSLYGKRRGSIEPLHRRERASRQLRRTVLFCSVVRNTGKPHSRLRNMRLRGAQYRCCECATSISWAAQHAVEVRNSGRRIA